MKARIWIAVVAVLCMQTSVAFAYFISGNKLWEFCEGGLAQDLLKQGGELLEQWTGAPISVQKYAPCTSYALGVIDSLENAVSSGLMAPTFCIPPGNQVTTEQITAIVAKFLKEHPEKRHLLGAAIVSAAATDAFPCENQTDEVQ